VTDTHGTNKKHKTPVEKPEERDHLKDLPVDEGIILKWVLKTGCEGVEQIQLAQDMTSERLSSTL
jgi:hypothetical protein